MTILPPAARSAQVASMSQPAAPPTSGGGSKLTMGIRYLAGSTLSTTRTLVSSVSLSFVTVTVQVTGVPTATGPGLSHVLMACVFGVPGGTQL